MTKTRMAAATLLACMAALLVPGAAAHGAPEAREIDLRVLADDDGLLAYGACFEGQCAVPAEGLDLLALDVREAWLGDEPAVVFRLVYQSEAGAAGAGLRLVLTANGTERTFVAASEDGTAFTASGFDALAGPFDVGDGFPKALDGWVLLATLGVAPGSNLTGISVASTRGESVDDIMPGTWYADGTEMPHLPHGPDAGEAVSEQQPGTYAVKGPAPLLVLQAAPAPVDLARASGLTVSVANPLSTLPQAILLVSEGATGRFPDGATSVALTLGPGERRDILVSWDPAGAGGNATFVATSDLGGRAVQDVQVVGNATVPPAGHVHEGHGNSAPTATPGTTAKDTPALAWAPAIAIAAAWAWRRR